ncbi:MAG TPA: type I phosphomannose isomerase catalytic subunit [Acidobacteriaceae bacterium]|jgi:mannose-6-phosphate isomerase|nr:type I phosphomannose isomerase catalytic subunit [Acidobacteriaceae bacterium]
MESLSPFRLAPYFRTRPWGFQDLRPWFDYRTDGEPIGEVWLTGEMCAAETGPLRGLGLAEITRRHRTALLGAVAARDFPLLVKILFPREKLSVQVHPDDALAQKYGEPRGKTECWYALDAQPGSQVALGIRPGVTAKRVMTAVEDGTLESLLEMVPVAKGDMIFVDAGTVHAVGPGAVLLETQQTSDLTYRMYDYGSARELHREKASAAMRLTTRAAKVAPRRVDGHAVLIDEKYFHVERWPVRAETARRLTAPLATVQILFVTQGRIQIGSRDAGHEPFAVERNQVAVVPAASLEWMLEGEQDAEVIRILPARG